VGSLRGRGAPASVIVLVLACLAACGGQGSGAPVPDGRIAVALQFAPRSGYAVDSDDAFLLSKLGVTETLVGVGADGLGVPRLATAWAQVDPTTWRFALRPGVLFSDGSPLTPARAADSLNRVAAAAGVPRAIKGVGLVAEADGTDALQVRTGAPDPILPLRLTSPNTAIVAAGAAPGTPPVATGPFVVSAARGTEGADLVRNDRYWGPRPRLGAVDVRFLTDAAARSLAVRSGDVQIAEGIGAAAVPELRATSGVSVDTVTSPRTLTLHLSQSGVFADPRLRAAVTAALDRPILGDQVLAGAGVPASDLFGPAVPWGSTARPPAGDPARARALLAEAGRGPGNPLSVGLWSYPNRPELTELVPAIQAMLGEAGIRTTVRIADYASLEPDLLAGRYDMMLLSRTYLSDTPDAGSYLSTDYTCAGSYNIDRYCSPAYDGLVGGLSGISAPQARQQVFRQAADMIDRESVGVPLTHSLASTATRDVGGFVADPYENAMLTPALTRTG
jgi:peptide/nickel transport system substrate-binding protein